MRESAGRWGWSDWERVRWRGKQVDSGGGRGEGGGCTVRYSNGLHVRHVVNVSARRCCTHGRTRGANVERSMRIVNVADLCGTVCIASASRGCIFFKNCGCYRSKNLKVLAVDCSESESVDEVLVINTT
jgi:hypothetical protein